MARLKMTVILTLLLAMTFAEFAIVAGDDGKSTQAVSDFGTTTTIKDVDSGSRASKAEVEVKDQPKVGDFGTKVRAQGKVGDVGRKRKLKFLAYVPQVGQGHINFLMALVHLLIDAGHQVTVLAPLMEQGNKYNTSGVHEFIIVPQSPANYAFEEGKKGFVVDIWRSSSISGFLAFADHLSKVWTEQCTATIHVPGLMARLRAERFDGAFGEIMDTCGLALFHVLGIERYAMTQSTVALDGIEAITGAPAAPSYVPGLEGDFGESMSFVERARNLAGLLWRKYLHPRFRTQHQALLESLYPGFPDIGEIYANCSLFFVNSEPLIDFPRPTIHRVIPIGGIGVPTRFSPLNEKWRSLLRLRRHSVLVSFGSWIKSVSMTSEMKGAIKEMARRLPNVTFIWKYETLEDGTAEDASENLVLAEWLPQNDILRSGLLSAFVSHGGANSAFESVHAGVPVIAVPVQSDQYRNAKMLARLGSAIQLSKVDLVDADVLVAAVSRVLNEERFRESARRTADMLANRPFALGDIFVQNMEFVARFGPLKQLDPEGRKMGMVPYFLLDVFTAVAAIVLLIVLVIALIIRCIWRTLFRRISKCKQD